MAIEHAEVAICLGSGLRACIKGNRGAFYDHLRRKQSMKSTIVVDRTAKLKRFYYARRVCHWTAAYKARKLKIKVITLYDHFVYPHNLHDKII